MKRIFALTLVLAVLTLLVACGDPAAPNVSDPVGSVSGTQTATGTVEPAGTTDTSAPEKTESEAAFDTDWAKNDFEALIPELPFSGWTVKNQTDSKYELELGGLKTANGASTASGFEEDKDALIRYLGTLPTYGFTVEETGENYKWLVTDAKGNTVEFTCGDGFCWVKFTKAN